MNNIVRYILIVALGLQFSACSLNVSILKDPSLLGDSETPETPVIPNPGIIFDGGNQQIIGGVVPIFK